MAPVYWHGYLTPVARRPETEDLVVRLMGKKPELCFQFMQEYAQLAKDIYG